MRTKLSLLLLLITITGAYAQPDDRIAKTPKINYDWRPGFVSTTELTWAIGLADTKSELSKYYYGITTVAGYQFTRNIKAGAGAGIHFHNDGNLFPLFLVHLLLLLNPLRSVDLSRLTPLSPHAKGKEEKVAASKGCSKLNRLSQ